MADTPGRSDGIQMGTAWITHAAASRFDVTPVSDNAPAPTHTDPPAAEEDSEGSARPAAAGTRQPAHRPLPTKVETVDIFETGAAELAADHLGQRSSNQ